VEQTVIRKTEKKWKIGKKGKRELNRSVIHSRFPTGELEEWGDLGIQY